MKVGEKKQHVPIFVGSTIEDLQDYRLAVRNALTQLETIFMTSSVSRMTS